MITIKLKGGMGNQMFQYAFGRMLSQKHMTELYLDTSHYLSNHPNETKRSFALDCFNIKAHIIDNSYIPPKNLFEKIISKIDSLTYHRLLKTNPYIFYESFLSSPNNSYLEGFWQSEKYFKNINSIIRKDFTLKKPLSDNAQRLQNQLKIYPIVVSIQIRRGDYVSNSNSFHYHGIPQVSYYKKAQSYIEHTFKEKPHYFICTDDPEWVKEHVTNESAYVSFASDYKLKDYEEIILMSQCTHHIISNSSFGWWGAWLNPNPHKIVVTPQQWIAQKHIRTDDVIPHEWIRI